MTTARVNLAIFFWLLMCVTAFAAMDYNFVEPDQLSGWLDSRKPLLLVDIQKPNDFKKHHFFGAVETGAYPVKTSGERRRLKKAVDLFEENGSTVVIIGPRGTRAEKRAFEYLRNHGVPADKIYILRGGIKQWPDKEMLLDTAGGCA
ncbi:rhodanese-like domain-containing protein [Desulfolithobacter sp.]